MRLGILISGRGSNMVAIVDAVKSGEIPDTEVAVVISDKAEAAGLERARERGVDTLVIERRGRTREEHDAEIITALKERGVDLVCLAGYMRLLSPSFVQAFPNKIINIHPSLLPAYPGLNVHEQVIKNNEQYSGCTVHFVDDQLDHGEIILQQWVPVEKGDDVSSLSERVLRLEHQLYVRALRYLAEELAVETGRKARNYKILKSIAHNFTHSFMSSMNYVEDDYVSDDIRDFVRNDSRHRLVIDWLSGQHTPGVSGRISKSVEQYRRHLRPTLYASGALPTSVSKFLTEIYLLKNHQIAVEAIIVDDRGRKYTTAVTNF